MDINTLKQVSLTYARAAGAAVVAMYLAGETDPKKLAYAFVAGFIGPVAKYFDKSAKDFGLTKQALAYKLAPHFTSNSRVGGFFVLPAPRMPQTGRKDGELRHFHGVQVIMYGSRVLIASTQDRFTPVYFCSTAC